MPFPVHFVGKLLQIELANQCQSHLLQGTYDAQDDMDEKRHCTAIQLVSLQRLQNNDL